MGAVWRGLKGLNTEQPSDPATPLPNSYPKDFKAGTPTDIRTLCS